MEYRDIIATAKPIICELPGGWEPADNIPNVSNSTSVITSEDYDHCKILTNVLSFKDCDALIALMNLSPEMEPVTVQGKDLTVNDTVGSMRTTIWCPQLAEQIWGLIGDFFQVEQFNELSPTDWWQGDKNRTTWQPIGISPMLRFMKYGAGGEHWAHYDAGFIYPNDNYRTLKSVVIYLTTAKRGGYTRIINDQQQEIPVWERAHDDWLCPTDRDNILFKSPCVTGSVFTFNHRQCHDVEVHRQQSDRIVIRTDILYQAV